MNTQFTWAPGYRGTADPQLVGQELERIRQRDGGITVDVVLSEARPPDAPLHPLCTWDDSVAAENWRRDEIRRAIRCLQVETLVGEPYKVFVHCANPARDQQGYYQRVEVAVQNINEYELVFKSAALRLGEAQRAMAELKRVAESLQPPFSIRRTAVVEADQALLQASEALAKAS